ncbi:uncharacterized protein M421DRAFT_90679 [Didymella exigua CBS 183.55]|uniref:Uncharacterized protein n=1 Tax=Didymella exigua CBS 183.55 TaxID=1150837 RepID=A0A6A5RV85_9PLEO|nr:uncharacterized protein M421DRAFT_90679 [Didymella exigua CBS 183.55]KAF1930888.1 hypothetical protein M421DRAFT_90679 [Didymella exigua CBS 183.55]
MSSRFLGTMQATREHFNLEMALAAPTAPYLSSLESTHLTNAQPYSSSQRPSPHNHTDPHDQRTGPRPNSTAPHHLPFHTTAASENIHSPGSHASASPLITAAVTLQPSSSTAASLKHHPNPAPRATRHPPRRRTAVPRTCGLCPWHTGVRTYRTVGATAERLLAGEACIESFCHAHPGLAALGFWGRAEACWGAEVDSLVAAAVSTIDTAGGPTEAAGERGPKRMEFCVLGRSTDKFQGRRLPMKALEARY